MQETEAMNFYQRIVEGTKQHKSITLEHGEGHALPDVEMHPIDKKTLASVIERLPQEMFDAVDEADGDAEEAEENMDGDIGAVTEDTVSAFEDLLSESLNHSELTKTQMRQIIHNLNFEILFELGTEVINISIEQTGDIQAFHEQS
jgi:hypothetical protein